MKRVTGGRTNGRPVARRHLWPVRGEGTEGWLDTVRIRGGARIPVGRQLEAHMSRAIGEGRVAPGSALPSTRWLAGRFPIHRNTVAAAYRRLARRGLVTVQQGRVARVVSVPGLKEDDGSADSAMVQDLSETPAPGVARVAVVAAGFGHRWAVVGDLLRQLRGDVEVYQVSPRAALARPGLLAGRLAVVALPILGPLLPLLDRSVPVAVLRYAPAASVLGPATRVPQTWRISTILTGCSRLRADLRALATGLDRHVFVPAPGARPRAMRYTVGASGRVWTDWMREAEARIATEGEEARIQQFTHTAPSTVRLLQRWILAG